VPNGRDVQAKASEEDLLIDGKHHWETSWTSICHPPQRIIITSQEPGHRDGDTAQRQLKRVGAENSVTSCDLQIPLYETAEAISS